MMNLNNDKLNRTVNWFNIETDDSDILLVFFET